MEEQLKCGRSDHTSRVQTHTTTVKFFYNLVIMYWTLNSIYMQFECQYPKSSYDSVEHMQLSRGMYCLKSEILRI